MRCVWCSKVVWVWQSTKPLGCDYLIDTFGQLDHDKCSDARRKTIEASQSRKAIAKLRVRPGSGVRSKCCTVLNMRRGNYEKR